MSLNLRKTLTLSRFNVSSRLSLISILAFTTIGCAKPAFLVTLSRSGGFSGTTQTYSVDQEGRGVRTGQWPQDSARSKVFTIDRGVTYAISDVLQRRFRELDTIHLQVRGNLTTSLNVKSDSLDIALSWPNLDPPVLQTAALDTLYHLMREVESRMASETR